MPIRHRNDFLSISPNRVRITGCGGSADVWIGTLQNNRARLRVDLYFPSLPTSVDHVLPFPGEHGMKENNWRLTFDYSSGHMVNTETGDIEDIYCSKDIELPILCRDFLIGANQNCFLSKLEEHRRQGHFW